MNEKMDAYDIKRNREDLENMKCIIYDSYGKLQDDIEIQHVRTQSILESGMLGKDEVTFFEKQSDALQCMHRDCETEKDASMQMVDHALTELEWKESELKESE